MLIFKYQISDESEVSGSFTEMSCGLTDCKFPAVLCSSPSTQSELDIRLKHPCSEEVSPELS